MAEHAVDFWLSTEDLPQPENRVTVDRDGNLTLPTAPSNDTARDRLFEQLRSLLGHLGMHEHHLIPALGLPGEQDSRRRRRPPGRAPAASAQTLPPRR